MQFWKVYYDTEVSGLHFTVTTYVYADREDIALRVAHQIDSRFEKVELVGEDDDTN